LIAWDLNADLRCGTAAISDGKVAIAIDEAAAPGGESSRVNFDI
jgi:hypothetical protein